MAARLNTTAVQDRLTISAEGLAAYLGINSADPLNVRGALTPLLEVLIAASKEAADTYLNNPFLDPDTGAERAIPAQVLIGCYKYCADLYARRVPGIVQDNAGDLSQAYSEAQIGEDVKKYWRRYRLEPGL